MFSDWLILIRRVISFGASNFIAGLFLYQMFHQNHFWQEQSTGSIIFGFCCIVVCLYDWWRAIRWPLIGAIKNTLRIRKMYKSGELEE